MVNEIQTRNWLQRLNSNFKDFCNRTSIHGFSHFRESRSLIEKIWWVIIISISFIGCVILIFRTYRKWELAPVIVSFATTETPIYHLPFPAVTICPDIKFRRKFYNYTDLRRKKMDNVTFHRIDQDHLEYMSMVCDQSYPVDEENILNKTFTENFYSFLKNATPNFMKYTITCSFADFPTECDDLFTPIITDEGVCYTYNMLDRTELFNREVIHYGNYHNINISSDDWNPETLQYGTYTMAAYPRRAIVSGAKASLGMWIGVLKEDIDYTCKPSLQGFRILLHHPAKIPRMGYHYFRLPLDQSVFAAIRPVMMTTSETLREYSPKSRGCFYPNERKLKYFQIYTQQNCMLECLTNFTLVLCNCSVYHMPRMRGEAICGMASVRCFEEVEINHPILGLATKFEEDHFDFYESFLEHHSKNLLDCNCLSACTSVDYNVEISQSHWEWRQLFQSFRVNISKFNRQFTEDNVHMSSFEIFFKTNQILGLERHELYGPTDFLANFGGVLGLFVGFSLISFAEIVYFITTRVIFNARIFSRQFWYPES